MGAKPSTTTTNGSPQRAGATYSTPSTGGGILRAIHVTTSDRQRARSLSSVPDLQENNHQDGIAIAFPGSNLQTYDMSVSPDNSSVDDSANNALGRVYTSLPSHIWSLNGKYSIFYLQ